ncbi:cell division protein FtsZ [Aquabacterium sp. UBA2148]|uniref:cell division protein FtsZ n=1 Tax=Aquabacterium sp. UBA2148 TaxID=1946042 RepID=UPI002579A5D7|nr:cell division protein FtsZ [Aquabacterium sp. UBA2148]
MNHSLTLYLAILGGIVLAAVVAHGAWTARRAAANQPRRATLEPVDSSVQSGLSLDSVPTEPMVDAGGPVSPEFAPNAAATSLPPVRRGGPRLDALVDAIATLTIESPLSGDHILLHLPPTRRAGSKPVLVEALRADCGEWELPQAGVLYTELQGGVLLANRTGSLNEIEYSEFVQKLQAMADALGAAVEFPDMLDVVARARELDAFASAHDAQLAMRLAAKGSAWSLGYVQQQAARHGFVPGVLPGRFVLPGAEDGAPPVLTLQFDAQAAFAEDADQATLRELLLCFDVPQTASELAPFKAWCAAGEALCLTMDAVMLDDQGQPFSPAAFAMIEGELHKLYVALAARDLAAGAPSTRRLFS